MYPKVDFLVGLFLVVFSTIGHFVADKLPPAKLGLGAGDYPKVILRVLFILGVIQAVYSWYQYRKSPQKDGGKKYEKGELKQVFILIFCVAVYIRLVAVFGFILFTPFFMFALMYIFGLRKWIKMGAISIVSTAVIYLIFNNLLYVILPRFTLFYLY